MHPAFSRNFYSPLKEKRLNASNYHLFPDICPTCSHVVAEHKHEFWIEEGNQEYRMDCLLCGTGEDSCPIDPSSIGSRENEC